MSINNYESILVVDSNMTDDEANAVFDKFKDVIAKAGGAVKFENSWGRRKLAYEVNKTKYGIFRLYYFEGNGAVVEEFEKQASYDENVLKFFVIGVNDLAVANSNFDALKEDPMKNSNLVSEVLGA